jgi:multisubunit Na+/H+ antiporter MnhG subunit
VDLGIVELNLENLVLLHVQIMFVRMNYVVNHLVLIIFASLLINPLSACTVMALVHENNAATQPVPLSHVQQDININMVWVYHAVLHVQ